MKSFDRKFGTAFLAGVPQSPGVYLIRCDQGSLIYVGKAKSLRRRLSQYRNVQRRKKHAKMRAIVRDASTIEIRPCDSELSALELETRLIQEHRPRLNIAGAFSFLYPLIGMRWTAEGQVAFCYTTDPQFFEKEGFSLHGCYRSRERTRDAFFALMELLEFVGHRSPRKKLGAAILPKYSYAYEFRRIPPEWKDLLTDFFAGGSTRALEALVLALVENAAARRGPSAIQERLRILTRFWRHEALLLSRACSTTSSPYPVSQSERDLVFLRFRFSHTHGARA